MAILNGSIILSQPNNTTEEQHRDFARLVRQGFKTAGSTLDSRIGAARHLAFHYSDGDGLVAIAALKSPDDQYRRDVFKWAESREGYADYALELGWVYVEPVYRGSRIATRLCEQLSSTTTTDSVFATTRIDNPVMGRILLACGFEKVGTPYPYREEQLSLYLRPC